MFGLPIRPAPKSVLERLRSYRHRTEKNADYAAAPDNIEQRARAAEGAPEVGLRELLAAETAARVALEARVAKLEKRAEAEARERCTTTATLFDLNRVTYGLPGALAERGLISKVNILHERLSREEVRVADLYEEIHAGAYGRDLARFHEVVGRISQLEDLTAGLRLAREAVAAVTPADTAHCAAELAGEPAEPEGPPEPLLTMEQFAALKRPWTGIPTTEPSAPAAAEATAEPSTSSVAEAAAADARRAIQIIEAELGPICEDRAAKAVARALLLAFGLESATALLRL